MNPLPIIAITLALLFSNLVNAYAAETNSGGTISGAVFERAGGYCHGFLSVAELYSDNIYYSDRDNASDTITRITPGVWFVLPGGKERLPETATASITPGGVVIRGAGSESFRRLRAHLFYSPEFEVYADHSGENTQRHLAEGSVAYNFSGGLTLGVKDQYHYTNDERGAGVTSATLALDKYSSNLFSVFGAYPISSKLSVEADYSRFYVDYLAGRNDFRDRNDASASAALFFQLFSKTALFGEYEYVDIVYDSENVWDGDEHHFFGGLRWRMTGKSTGMIKAGWGLKNYDIDASEQENIGIFQAKIDYAFTAYTGMTISAYRRTNESNIETADYTVTDNLSVTYSQRIRKKIKASFELAYTRDSYNSNRMGENVAGDREDEIYDIVAAVNYAFRKWITAGVEYTHAERDSSFEDYEYSVNEFLFKISCSL
ncbi:MAG: outer membrane beta-barrel protein [Desulfobacterales bacterium]|jgi:hypothetical protein|nr:outer membrane beta-barrel protein [Desulfobacterales bacterium]